MLVPAALCVFAAMLVQGTSAFALTRIVTRAALQLTARLSMKVQAHIGRLELRYHDTNKTGILVSRILRDVESVRSLVGAGLVQFGGDAITAAVACWLMLRIDVVMTLATGALLTGFIIALRRGFRASAPRFAARMATMAEVTGRLTESLGGVRVVKGFHAEAREEQVFAAGARRIADVALDAQRATSLIGLVGTAFSGLVATTVLLLGAQRILAHQMPLGTYVMFTMLAAMLTTPVLQLVSLAPDLMESVAGLQRTRQVLREPREDADGRRHVAIGRIRGMVRVEEVSFTYDGHRRVLDRVSFQSAPGTVTALVGRSGAGKSTLAALLAAFYRPSDGRILVDGIDLDTVTLGSYRSQLGFVLQDPFLFDGTIADNVAFGRPDASDASIEAACRLARVDEFIASLPAGYKTVVGERGVKLSGGQRQRIAIARAILADPRILILDEATASLDSTTEALIQEGLRTLMRDRTTFVIAHRLSTIRDADQILLIESGQITERGTHDSLYAARGRYYELYSRQLNGVPESAWQMT
jgi:subfamily B ATP-binding cassette protein MsbA